MLSSVLIDSACCHHSSVKTSAGEWLGAFPPSCCCWSKDEGEISTLLVLDERQSSISPGCVSLTCAVRRRTWTWRWILHPPSGVMLSILVQRTWEKGNPTWSLGFFGRSLRLACLLTSSLAEMKVSETKWLLLKHEHGVACAVSSSPVGASSLPSSLLKRGVLVFGFIGARAKLSALQPVYSCEAGSGRVGCAILVKCVGLGELAEHKSKSRCILVQALWWEWVCCFVMPQAGQALPVCFGQRSVMVLGGGKSCLHPFQIIVNCTSPQKKKKKKKKGFSPLRICSQWLGSLKILHTTVSGAAELSLHSWHCSPLVLAWSCTKFKIFRSFKELCYLCMGYWSTQMDGGASVSFI